MSYVTLSNGSAYRIERIVALQPMTDNKGWAILVDLGVELLRSKLPTEEDVAPVRSVLEEANNAA